jgi:hypothetical protein
MLGIGLSLTTPAVYGSKGIPGDLYPSARIAFDPVNSWYKVGNFGTSDLAEFLAQPEVSYSSDPTAGISDDGYTALDAYDLSVDWAAGNSFMVLIDAIFLPIPDDDDADQLIWAGVTNANGGQYLRAGQTDFASSTDAPKVYWNGATQSGNQDLDFPSAPADNEQIRLAFGYDGTENYRSWQGSTSSGLLDFASPADKIWLGDAPNEVPGGTVKRILVYPAWDETVANAWTNVTAFAPEVVTLLNAMTVKPDDTRQALINTYVRDLKSAGVWDKLDLLYMIAAHDSQAARLNWITPASFAATNVGAGPTFVADRGITGNGSSTAWTTGWTAGTHGVNFVQDDASMWVWCRTNVAENMSDFGAAITHNSFIRSRSAGNAISYTLNGATTSTPAIATSVGMTGISRADGTNQQAWKNGAASGAAAAGASTGLPGAAFRIGGRANDHWSTKQIAMCATGAALSVDEVADFYAATLAYMQGVGAA